MVTKHVAAESQQVFCALLRYFHHGDFATFCKAADLAYGLEATSDRYFCANLLYASQVCGLCEVSTATGVTQWWVSHEHDVHIDSLSAKTIGVSQNWFSGNARSVVPLVKDTNSCPLILGARRLEAAGDESHSMFEKPLTSVLPPFKDIEQELCAEVPYTDESAANTELFVPNEGRWQGVDFDSLEGSHLIRMRKEYSGMAYFIQHSQLGIRFRITQPEWAFVVAYHLLPWRIADILKIDDVSRTLTLHRAVRLPIMMCRLLFAAADSLSVGPLVTYQNVRTQCLASTLSYFSAVGERR